MNWIMRIIVNWATLMVVAGMGLFDDFIIEGPAVALLAAFILSIMNGIIKPILVFFTLPITILSFGLFLFVINAITLKLTSMLISGFEIGTFLTALVASIIISILNFLIQNLIVDRLRK